MRIKISVTSSELTSCAIGLKNQDAKLRNVVNLCKTMLEMEKVMANKFEFQIRVYIEDTDAGGIVYHANHIRFMERARTEWLRASGISHYWHQKDYNFVVHKIGLKYSRPILMDDLITVTASVVSCKATSFVLQQNIYRGEIMLASDRKSVV